ncbi:hypothetical protein DPMN_137599 [Dreissena polymorpha]|uniref:C1q domain-containing protein n=2 Tax=Dreissena polymorpha TaxID=45954 RepID=A0A9D4JHT6_DREPO|nr:hypothetical protein DPMN_137599 [Dreissena polymorpha]
MSVKERTMLPAIILLLAYNFCCTHAYTFLPDQMDGTDLLLELLKRMDAKDKEINELRGSIKTAMTQIDTQDLTIDELRKKVFEHEHAISVMEQNQKRQDANVNKLNKVVKYMQVENVQLRKLYSKCGRKIQTLHLLIKNGIKKTKTSPTLSQEETANYIKDDKNAINDKVEIRSNKFESSITATHDGGIAIGKTHKGRDVNSQADVKRHAGTDLVAFFATLTNHATNLSVGQNLKFDNIITNVGSAYNQHVGAFHAPVSGVYVFMSTLMSYDGQSGHFQLVRNGNIVCFMFVAGSSGVFSDTSGSSYVLYLNKGDVITIQNMQSGKGVLGTRFSFFSGFLLKEIEQDPSIVG